MHTDSSPTVSPDPTANGAHAPSSKSDGVSAGESTESDAAPAVARRARATPSRCVRRRRGTETGLLYTLSLRTFANRHISHDRTGSSGWGGERTADEGGAARGRRRALAAAVPDGGAKTASRVALQRRDANGRVQRGGTPGSRDGSTFWAYVNLTAMRNQHGRLVRVHEGTRTSRHGVRPRLPAHRNGR